MVQYISRRFLIAIPMLLGAMSIVFFAMRVLPGDPEDSHSRYIEAAVSGLLVGCLRALKLPSLPRGANA